MNQALLIRLDDLGLSIEHEPKRPAHGHHRERLERCVQRQTPDDHVALLYQQKETPAWILRAGAC
jgi:hypothetical protein